MTRSRFESRAHLPRHAFSARDCARAGDVWRAFQEVAVEASTSNGWPPDRYRSEGTAFVMRSMSVAHRREAVYGEDFRATTWVRRMRRGMLSTREVRLWAGQDEIAAGTQEWVHVDSDMKPSRGPASLVDAFPVLDEGESVVLPESEPLENGREFQFEFDVWFTWMDPLDHVNHPAYMDFAEESLAREMRRVGFDPLGVVPLAETVTFFRGLEAGQRARVSSRIVGSVGANLVSTHRIETLGDTPVLCASATLVRGHPDDRFTERMSAPA